MGTGIPKIEDWGLSDKALELLWDFRTSPHFYFRWLFYANDRLLDEANENMEDCSECLQCMHALKHIRSLLEVLQDKDVFDVENDE